MEKRKVSIIIPCYNKARYLPETLESILAQTMTDWECIVVDDGSTDDTRKVMDSYIHLDERFSYIYQENQGPSIARNNGIAHTTGVYILPVDADDRIANSYLEKASAYLDNHPETTLVYGEVEYFGEQSGLWEIPDYNYEDFIWGRTIIICSAMYRRIDYEKTSGYNPNMQYGLEDWDFWLTLLNRESIVYRINDVMYYYRKQALSRSSYANDHFREVHRAIYNNHPQIYEPYAADIIALTKELHETKYMESLRVRQSYAYRIGAKLLKPLKCGKKIINSLFHT